jgi:hypothetical protein
MNIDSERIPDYASWQHTVSEHQARIQQYLGLRPFDLDESNAPERFAFEESCRLEQTALLLARAQESWLVLAVVAQEDIKYSALGSSVFTVSVFCNRKDQDRLSHFEPELPVRVVREGLAIADLLV